MMSPNRLVFNPWIGFVSAFLVVVQLQMMGPKLLVFNPWIGFVSTFLVVVTNDGYQAFGIFNPWIGFVSAFWWLLQMMGPKLRYSIYLLGWLEMMGPKPHEEIARNYVFLKPLVETFPDVVPGAVLLTDIWVYLNDMFDQKLLCKPEVDAVTQASQEASRCKRLIGSLRYLYRNSFSVLDWPSNFPSCSFPSPL